MREQMNDSVPARARRSGAMPAQEITLPGLVRGHPNPVLVDPATSPTEAKRSAPVKGRAACAFLTEGSARDPRLVPVRSHRRTN
jgi:hypothetical protein